MRKWQLWALFIIAMACFDALRDVGRGQFGYWVWHVCKWASFYPPLAYLWYDKVFRFRPKIGIVVVIIAWIGWSVMAQVWRPEHWGDGGLINSIWLSWW